MSGQSSRPGQAPKPTVFPDTPSPAGYDTYSAGLLYGAELPAFARPSPRAMAEARAARGSLLTTPLPGAPMHFYGGFPRPEDPEAGAPMPQGSASSSEPADLDQRLGAIARGNLLRARSAMALSPALHRFRQQELQTEPAAWGTGCCPDPLVVGHRASCLRASSSPDPLATPAAREWRFVPLSSFRFQPYAREVAEMGAVAERADLEQTRARTVPGLALPEEYYLERQAIVLGATTFLDQERFSFSKFFDTQYAQRCESARNREMSVQLEPLAEGQTSEDITDTGPLHTVCWFSRLCEGPTGCVHGASLPSPSLSPPPADPPGGGPMARWPFSGPSSWPSVPRAMGT
ncbi:hypothetical protein, variant [Fonticula alba]|uniref:Uncharacterized protein n=1 Tax=Fonticula alba TaxID=691883 RepID=A0A058Z267_FONAL|nr:hypothetical protein, variant [Fonticula alba]KCV67998.1 hypothetical protein, variant [Fonticula alba]|eukprot:XP_009497565.1 hypothetical protein, variant [Fonticula alba]